MSFREEEIIVLIDEDNNEIEFEIIEIFETENGNQYAFLFPLDEEEESIIMKVVMDENDEEILVEIEDDEEWEEVIKAWEEYISELEDGE